MYVKVLLNFTKHKQMRPSKLHLDISELHRNITLDVECVGLLSVESFTECGIIYSDYFIV